MSEPETDAEPRNASRNDVGDIAERRTRLEIRRGRRRRVQHVEDVDGDIDPARRAERKILAGAKVQDVLRRQSAAAVRLDANRGIAVLSDGLAAIGIDLPEDVRSLARHAVL